MCSCSAVCCVVHRLASGHAQSTDATHYGQLVASRRTWPQVSSCFLIKYSMFSAFTANSRWRAAYIFVSAIGLSDVHPCIVRLLTAVRSTSCSISSHGETWP